MTETSWSMSWSDVARAAIQQHALAEFPHEACGVLCGTGNHILAAHPAKNCTPAGSRFELEPLDYLQVAHAAAAVGTEIVGIYHSHPEGAAEPSVHDLEQARRLWPSGSSSFLWVIAAVSRDAHVTIRAFHLRDARFVAAAR